MPWPPSPTWQVLKVGSSLAGNAVCRQLPPLKPLPCYADKIGDHGSNRSKDSHVANANGPATHSLRRHRNASSPAF